MNYCTFGHITAIIYAASAAGAIIVAIRNWRIIVSFFQNL